MHMPRTLYSHLVGNANGSEIVDASSSDLGYLVLVDALLVAIKHHLQPAPRQQRLTLSDSQMSSRDDAHMCQNPTNTPNLYFCASACAMVCAT